MRKNIFAAGLLAEALAVASSVNAQQYYGGGSRGGGMMGPGIMRGEGMPIMGMMGDGMGRMGMMSPGPAISRAASRF
jgi:hypothetical protein